MNLPSFSLTMQIFQEGNTYIAHSPELDVSSCGETPEKARKNFQTAVALFVKEAEKMGTLQQILQEAGFLKKGAYAWEAPQWIAFEKVAIPFHA